jgi:glycosyltransferase involved in cell wall biosynthesis
VNVARFSRTPESAAAASGVRAELGIPEGAPVLGFVGRLVRDKGIVELTAAWRVLREEFPALHLVLVGGYEEGDPVPEVVKQALDSDERVRVLGWVSDSVPYYAAFDLLVLPTYREGFPNVLLEAAGMELPIVATLVPGCVDAVEDGTTGLLVPARDAERLAAALRRYLADARLREQHGAAGRERVVRLFQSERIWEGLVREYDALLSRGAIRAPGASRAPEPARVGSRRGEGEGA